MKNNQNTKTTNKTQPINKWTLIKELNEILGFVSMDDNSDMVGWFVSQSKENLKKIRTKLKVFDKEIDNLFDKCESFVSKHRDKEDFRGVINLEQFGPFV